MKKTFLLAALGLFIFSCQKDPDSATDAAKLNFQFRFDPQQQRLDNLGQPSTIKAGNAAQTPVFRKMSVHYIELAPKATTQLGSGAVVFTGAEVGAGNARAVDFDRAAVAGEGVVFASIDLSSIPPGTYEWVRASVTYQNYDIVFNLNGLPVLGDLKAQRGTVASFVGFNTQIGTVTPRERPLVVNAAKKQGFWAFETDFSGSYSAYNDVWSGQAPAGATTVVNPLASTSPIPAGSCVVTGKLAQPLTITGKETADATVELSFSINKSFEWQDLNSNGELDFYASGAGSNEPIVDMGLRGLIPVLKN